MRDCNHAKGTAAAHCNHGESHFHLQNMLIAVVGHSLERLRLAGHGLDASRGDIEGAEPADNWAEDIQFFYDHLSEHCNPYLAVRTACCLHPRTRCRDLNSTARS